jgi:predicted permease
VLSSVLNQDERHVAILAEFSNFCDTYDRWKAPTRKKAFVFFTSVKLSPSTTALPGSAALQQLANGIAAWALVGTLIGLLFGAGMWALGSNTQNSSQSVLGRRAVFASLIAAVLIGAAPHLINFFFATGQKVK